MNISGHFEPGTGTWAYLLADPVSKKAAIIDPVLLFDPVSGLTDSSFADEMLDAARKEGYRIEWVIETHAHADHLSAGQYICNAVGASLAASRGITKVQETFVRVFNLPGLVPDGSQFDRLLQEGDVLQLGELRLSVLETPGHTPDSISLVVEDAAFIGDTLFAPQRGSARCDFPGGDAGVLFDSVQKLYALPETTRLFLCHDYPAEGQQPIRDFTVAESRRDNIHIKGETTRAEFVAMREARDATLSLPRLILPSVQVNVRGRQAVPAETNGVAYIKLPYNRSIKNILQSG
jgi:glyoxylase-like metal-dependent hydrolase (beta-lactamase superfamily II)